MIYVSNIGESFASSFDILDLSYEMSPVGILDFQYGAKQELTPLIRAVQLGSCERMLYIDKSGRVPKTLLWRGPNRFGRSIIRYIDE